MTAESYDVLIVSGRHAGAQATVVLRQRHFEGSIANIREESELPYERPPLSKDYLSGEKSFDRIVVRPATLTDRSIPDAHPSPIMKCRGSGPINATRVVSWSAC